MSDLIYYCTNDNNTCVKKETCKRYLNAENKNHAPLFNRACTKNNNYVLYMKVETKESNNNESSGNA